MSLNKLRLTPESRRTLFEQMLQFVNQHEPDKQKNEQLICGKNPSMLSFIKLMCASRSFLIISRSFRFDIYRLSLEIEHDDFLNYRFQKLYVNSCYSICDKSFALSIDSENLSKFILFLKPLFIGLYIDKQVKLIEVEHIFEFLRKTDAKIGLFLNLDLKYDDYLSFENDQRFDAQLKEFAPRINALECDVSYLDFETVLPLPILDSLTVKGITNFDQLARILRYKAKSLYLEFYDDYFSWGYFNRSNIERISNEQLNSMKNTHAKSLRLHFRTIFYTESFISKLLKLFPNLTSITIQISPGLDELRINRIANDLVLYQQEMRDLNNSLLAAGLKHVSISLSIRFHEQKKTYSNSWIKAMRTRLEFADWNYKTEQEHSYGPTDYSVFLDKQGKNFSLSIFVCASVCGYRQNDDSNVSEEDDEFEDDTILEDIANLFE